jgi:IS30 family transposase
VARNPGDARGYEAIGAVSAARGRRRRGLVQLREGSVLREIVITHIRKGWSPQQISGTLAGMSEPVSSVSHATIYQMIYLLPRGEICRKKTVSCVKARSCAAPACKARTGAAASLA